MLIKIDRIGNFLSFLSSKMNSNNLVRMFPLFLFRLNCLNSRCSLIPCFIVSLLNATLSISSLLSLDYQTFFFRSMLYSALSQCWLTSSSDHDLFAYLLFKGVIPIPSLIFVSYICIASLYRWKVVQFFFPPRISYFVMFSFYAWCWP